MSFFQNVLSFFRLKNKALRNAIKERTGVKPVDISLYEMALMHSSFLGKNLDQNYKHNQRLEFLGDAILGAVAADYLYQQFPEKDEGFLTNLRSKIVSRKSLNAIALQLELDLLVKKKLDKNKQAHSIYGDAFEALVGAIYLDKGIKYAQNFIIDKVIATHWGGDKLETYIVSYKSTFIEWAQKKKKEYNISVIREWGEKHDLTFEVVISVDGEEITRGQGSSKKRAEETASQTACKELNLI